MQIHPNAENYFPRETRPRPRHQRVAGSRLECRPMRDPQRRRWRHPGERKHLRSYLIRDLARPARWRPVHQTFHAILLVSRDPLIHRRPGRTQRPRNFTLPAPLRTPTFRKSHTHMMSGESANVRWNISIDASSLQHTGTGVPGGPASVKTPANGGKIEVAKYR